MDNSVTLYERLKQELDTLPVGYISQKNINGKVQYYLQWRENGKLKSKYIRKGDLETVREQIARRKELEPVISRLKLTLPRKEDGSMNYETNIMTCESISDRLEVAAKLKRRDCFVQLLKSLYSKDMTRVTAVYGLRRTGKTTMLYQAMAEMPKEMQEKTVYIKLKPENDMAQLNRDLYRLKDAGYQYIFIDEVTLANDFIDGASLFSDVFTAMGMHFVLSGTDSLGLWFARDNELYDRVRMIHTTVIPYREYNRLLEIDSIDEYIRYGGTLRAGEIDFDDDELNVEDASFRDDESTRRYVDTAIAKNIQRSLACFEYGKYFGHLQELYSANELTGAINRIVEDMNHSFVVQVLTDPFESHDLGISARNLRKEKDPQKRTDILDRVDREQIVAGLMRLLEIRNKEEQSVGITESHIAQIKMYLKALDLIAFYEIEPATKEIDREERVIFTQPGMRYCQAQALVHELMKDSTFGELSQSEKRYVADRILEEVRGRMLEDIVLFETSRALPKKQYEVFKLRFASGEYDMVIWDSEQNRCALYEIKHSAVYADPQARHLRDEEKLNIAEYKFGNIVGRYVLYSGESFNTEDGIAYRNVEQFLKQLPTVVLQSGLEETISEDETQGFKPTM